MATRLKEDEKNERIIRSLLKQPANRKCINCNSLGPQYVCTTFWTFVCTTCGGIHREFTHRVKSVSMAKFTPQEVSSLQAGGNERAKEIYFKELDAHRCPDSSNVDRLRDFIKHIYVDRRYTGDRSTDKPPRAKMGDREEPYDSRRPDSYRSGSRSPPYEDTYGMRCIDRASPGYEGRRSPGFDQDNQRHCDYGRSPGRSGIVNDWRREDRFTNGRRSEEHRSSVGDSGPEGRSPNSQKDASVSSPPMVRPVREILGDNAMPVGVIEPPHVSGGKISEGSAQPTQRTASSSSLASSNGSPSELKKVDSLINFDADPKPPASGTLTQPHRSAPTQPVASSTTSTGGDNWACFDNASEAKPPQTAANGNPLESMLTQLSVPAPTPAPLSAFPTPSGHVSPASLVSAKTNVVDSLFASPAQAPVPSGNAPALASNGVYASVPSNTTMLPNNNASFSPGSAAGNLSPLASGLTSTLTTNGGVQQLSNMQNPQQFPFPGSGQGVSAKPVVQVPETGVRPVQTPAGIAARPVETKSSGRKELPADLFTATYPSYPLAVHGWQTGLFPGMGYHMQYNTAAPMRTFPHPAKSMNPFDVGIEVPPSQPTFPSMAPLQTALPNMAAPAGLVRTSSPNMVAPSWIPSQPAPYPSIAPQMTLSLGKTVMPPGTYTGQQVPSNLPPSRNQGPVGFGNEAAGFGSLNPTPSTPNPSGNPFG